MDVWCKIFCISCSEIFKQTEVFSPSLKKQCNHMARCWTLRINENLRLKCHYLSSLCDEELGLIFHFLSSLFDENLGQIYHFVSSFFAEKLGLICHCLSSFFAFFFFSPTLLFQEQEVPSSFSLRANLFGKAVLGPQQLIQVPVQLLQELEDSSSSCHSIAPECWGGPAAAGWRRTAGPGSVWGLCRVLAAGLMPGRLAGGGVPETTPKIYNACSSVSN